MAEINCKKCGVALSQEYVNDIIAKESQVQVKILCDGCSKVDSIYHVIKLFLALLLMILGVYAFFIIAAYPSAMWMVWLISCLMLPMVALAIGAISHCVVTSRKNTDKFDMVVSAWWKKHEGIVASAARLAWILPLATSFVIILEWTINVTSLARLLSLSVDLLWSSFVDIGSADVAFKVYSIFVMLIVDFTYVIFVFGRKGGKRDWTFLMENGIRVRKRKIPNIFVFALVLEIFGFGWAGLGVLVPAFLIFLLGPKNT